jgi:hypothetical protein
VYIGTEIANIGVGVLLLFCFIITLLMPSNLRPVGLRAIFTNPANKNTIIVVAALLALGYILVTGYDMPGIGERRGSPTSTAYEASFAILLVAYYFCGDNKPLRCSLLAVSLCLAAQCIIGGDRIAAIQFILVYFTIYHLEDIPIKRMMSIGFFSLVFLVLVGSLRGTILSSFSLDEIVSTLEELINTKGGYIGFPAAYHASLTSIDFATVIPDSERLYYLKQFLLGQILGLKNVADANLTNVTYRYYWHNGGSICSVFGFFYLGFVGVALSALLTVFYNHIVARVSVKANPLLVIMASTYIVLAFRWYSYTPTPLIRTMCQTLLLFAVSYTFYRLVSARTKRRKRASVLKAPLTNLGNNSDTGYRKKACAHDKL